jgi:glycosyltransferase involved in cell wall biosynthesis
MPPPTDVSFCMIVRNGSATLGDCLGSVAGLADEFVVVDTGSTDASPELARAYGARVIRARWREDFSAARNHYLKAARCGWVLSLDADEVLERVDRDSFRELLKAHPDTAFFFNIHNYFFARGTSGAPLTCGDNCRATPGVGCSVTKTVRLFPKRRGVRYCFPVHESLVPALVRREIRLTSSAFTVHHRGHLCTGDATANKAKLYRALGEKKVRQFPGYFLGYHELGKILLYEGHPLEAERMFTKCVRLNPVYPRAYYYLGLTLLAQSRRTEGVALLRRAARLFPRRSDIAGLIATAGADA